MKKPESSNDASCGPDVDGNGMCALLQPPVLIGMTLPAASFRSFGSAPKPPAQEPGATAAFEYPRITHMDRAMIRIYFRRHDTDEPSPSSKEGDRRVSSALQPRDLPPALEQKLMAVPAGYRRVLVGHDVMLVEVASALVVDVVRDVDDTSLA